jgi:hypothetical protein
MARLEDDAMPPVVKKTSSSEFDTAIRNIQQIIADSKAAREARQAAAIERKKELDAQREAAFAPIYERIETARQNVLAIKERLTPDPIIPEVIVPKPKTIVSDTYVGECANRKRVVTYSDGTSSTFPAPEDCGGGLTTSLIDTPTSVPTPTPVPPKPPAPPPPPPPPPKTAPLDTILFDDESVPIEIMSDMIFEDIGGHELINVARNDTINGQTVTYQPIKNLTSIQQQYNPNNIVGLQNTSDKYFANFSIKLETKLPEEGNGPDGAYVYIDTDTGDLIVELINLDPDEQIEVQISLSGTIYEAEFNES